MPVRLHELENAALGAAINAAPTIEKIMSDIDERLQRNYSTTITTYEVWEGRILSNMIVEEIMGVIEKEYSSDFCVRNTYQHERLTITFEVRNDALKKERQNIVKGGSLLQKIEHRNRKEEEERNKRREEESARHLERIGSTETRLMLEKYAISKGMEIEWSDEPRTYVGRVHWSGWGKASSGICAATIGEVDRAIAENKASISLFKRCISWILLYVFIRVELAKLNSEIKALPAKERALEAELYQQENMGEVEKMLAFPVGSEKDNGDYM